MTRVYRIRGVAGAGKTAKSMDIVSTLRESEGYEPSDYRFISFSRSHAADLENDVLDAWNDSVAQLDDDQAVRLEDTLISRVSTLHSLCAKLTHTPTIITPATDTEIYESFWSAKGLKFDLSESSSAFIDPDENVDSRSRIEKLLAADQLLAQLGAGLDSGGIDLAPHALSHIPVEFDLHASRVISLMEEWREYKSSSDVKEHHDYILDAANSKTTPDCKILVVDEMQDYAPLEYSIVRDWIDSGDLDHAILAGDEYQSIYGFKLADPSYFTGRDVDEEEILTESYRCPKAMCDVARTVCPSTDITSARDDDGEVIDVDITTPVELGNIILQLVDRHPVDPYASDPTSIFILTRTNRQAAKVGWALRNAGIPYSPTNQTEGSPWTDGVLDAIEVLRLAASGGVAVPRDMANSLFDMATNSVDRRKMAEKPDFDGLEVSSGAAINLWTAFPDCESVSDIVDALDVESYIAEMIRGAMRSDADLSPGLVEVGTIHSAKGREAPSVVICDGYPHRLNEKYNTDDEFAREEDRLAYVAATRASESLVIARDFIGGCTFPPLSPSEITHVQPEQGVMGQ